MSDDQQRSWENYPAALSRDTILVGRYIIRAVLGQGGFGITYLAEDHQGKGDVAVMASTLMLMETNMMVTGEITR